MLTAFYNAKVYVEENTFAQAVLIKDHRIALVGSDEEVLTALREENSLHKAIDCRGRTLLPGFNDSHNHFIFSGRQLTEAQITQSTSIDDLVERCSSFMEKNPLLTANGMHGFGWNQDRFNSGEKRMPNRHDLDRISTDIPIVLERVCAHIAVANTKAIALLGLDENSPQFEGGFFEQEDDGFPSGIFNEKACEPLLQVLPSPTMEERQSWFIAAMKYAVSVGLTSVQSSDIGVIGDDHLEILEMMDDVYRCGEGILRYRHQVYCTSLALLEERIRDGIFQRKAKPDGMHVVGSLKIFKDGSLGGRTALLRKGYRDMPHLFGVEAISREEALTFCKKAADNDIQTLIHAIGDAAIEEVLDLFEETGSVDNPLRNTIVHCQITDLPLLKRITQNNILIQYQPIFLTSDMQILESLIGEDLAATSYAFRKALEMQGSTPLVSFGTDAPVEDCNPFPNIYCAVTRKDLSGNPPEGFYSGESLTVSQAVDAYTLGSAYAEFMEEAKGRIKPGYLADLILLDQDIFSVPPNRIKDIKPVLTMVNGKIVYEG